MKELEVEYLDRLQKHLESKGYQIFREVVPDECKNWKQPLRVDMIIYRYDIDYIGVEAKRVRSTRQGSIFSKAFLQIVKYRKLTYFNGRKIDNWAITYTHNHWSNDIENEMFIFLANFFSVFDVKMLRFKEYKNRSYNNVSLNPGLKGSKRLD